MKTCNRKALEWLFPHHNDPAYQSLGDLEELIAGFVATGTTAPFKQRLQRAIARISEALVELADDGGSAQREGLLFKALVDCRKAGNGVTFLYRARVLPHETRVRAFDLLSDIVQELINRVHALRGLPRPMPLARPTFADDIGAARSQAADSAPQVADRKPPGEPLDS
jgi:hypothetical protein